MQWYMAINIGTKHSSTTPAVRAKPQLANWITATSKNRWWTRTPKT